MILDDRLEFADATALNTGAAGTYNLGDVIDLRSPTTAPNVTVDLEGSDLYLVAQVDTAATSGGAATLQLRLVSDDTSTPNTSTAAVHYTSAAIPVASLTAGAVICATKLPAGSYKRYLGIQQVTGTAAFTGGKINAFLTSDPALWRPYADNVG